MKRKKVEESKEKLERKRMIGGEERLETEEGKKRWPSWGYRPKIVMVDYGS